MEDRSTSADGSMQQGRRRLQVARETLRGLGQSILRQAAGGSEYENTDPHNCSDLCESFSYCSVSCPDTQMGCSGMYCSAPNPATCYGQTYQCTKGTTAGGAYC
jgi:hypothetical protein